MHDILISSPAFDSEKTKQYMLSIQLCLDGFSFSVCDTLSNKFIHLKYKPFAPDGNVIEQVEAFIHQETLLNLPYKKVVVVYDLSPSTLVPIVLFDETKRAVYYGRNYNPGENSTIVHDQLKNQDYVLVYAINEALNQVLAKTFNNLHITHLNSLKMLASDALANTQKNLVLLTIRQNSFSVTVFRDAVLLLQNSFNYQTEDEFLYFLLYCFNQLKLDQQKTVLEIDGVIPKHASLIKQLERFIQHVSFAPWPEACNFANDFYDMPAHYFTPLYTTLLCE